MLKKLLIILISTLSLAGCGEVTEDMLIGVWSCDSIDSRKYYNKKGELIDERTLQDVYTNVTYKKGDIVIFSRSSSLLPLKSETEFKNIDWESEVKHKEEYVFISNDKFNIVLNYLIRYRQTKITEETGEQVITCTRVKN